MAKQGGKGGRNARDARARLFIALDLPEPVRAAIARWQEANLGDPALRPIGAQGLHVTLCFLGERPQRAVARIRELVEAVPRGPIELAFEPQPAALPKGRPGLYALAARSEAARVYQRRLADALTAENLLRPEKRRFWPHVTVARVRSERLSPAPGERRGKSRPRRVARPPGALPTKLTEPFGAVRVALYRSNLKPEGAEYVSLAGVDLPRPGQGRERGD